MVGVVVDTSALVAILLEEVGSEDALEHLAAAESRLLSAVSRVELGLVVESRIPAVGRDLVERLLRDASVEIVDVDADLADRTVSAWRRFGKGRHPAGLNFGDCFSYALAERTGLPLLCTSADFAKTDLDVLSIG
jgi:ribonuclease VapC